MTFPARLTELLEKATKGPYLLEKGIVGRPTITGAGLIGRSTIAEFCDDAEGWADAESFLLFLNHAEALRDLVVAAEKIEPYLDAIICYASTMGEHEPNRIANNFRKAITELNKS